MFVKYQCKFFVKKTTAESTYKSLVLFQKRTK